MKIYNMKFSMSRHIIKVFLEISLIGWIVKIDKI